MPRRSQQRPRAQVCDFGLARALAERMAVDRELVTLWYRAPELLMGDASYSPKARPACLNPCTVPPAAGPLSLAL